VGGGGGGGDRRHCKKVADAVIVTEAGAAVATIRMAEALAAGVGAEAHVFSPNNVSAQEALIAPECRCGQTRSLRVAPDKTSVF
jgi:hypothetical protein